MLSGKTVLVGITGGIAAYKICELIRMFKRENANVKVICTHNALNFVTKLTLQNLSQNEVGIEEFDIKEFKPEHISYADEADIMVIAPATANTIGKIANGICDNLLTSVVCAFKKPIILAPAMNCGMWENPLVQENLSKLRGIGFTVLEPEEGFLACGYNGKGRLCSLDKIFNKSVELLNQTKTLAGKRVVITAGGTIEEIDSVRYISNYSSGKMGISLADYAFEQGAEVTLISTVPAEKPYSIINVKSAQEMQGAVENLFGNSDCIIMAAAVADYKVKNSVDYKMKKTDADFITLELVQNPDILKSLSERKKETDRLNSETNQSLPVIVGFCAESENLLKNAQEKIAKKGCDYLVANDISRKDIGFSSDYNEVLILDKDGGVQKIERAPKKLIAEKIFKAIYE